MNGRYILADDGRTPVPMSDFMTWAKWFEDDAKRRVGEDTIGDARVSTVFLALNHSFGRGAPVLWETMIFGGTHNQYQERYSTYDEAVTGHAKALALAQEK